MKGKKMTLQKATPFVGSAEFGKALNSPPRKVRVTFNDGKSMSFTSQADAEFWADFTGRTIVENA